jgi:hypothetical protein
MKTILQFLKDTLWNMRWWILFGALWGMMMHFLKGTGLMP